MPSLRTAREREEGRGGEGSGKQRGHGSEAGIKWSRPE